MPSGRLSSNSQCAVDGSTCDAMSVVWLASYGTAVPGGTLPEGKTTWMCGGVTSCAAKRTVSIGSPAEGELLTTSATRIR